MMGEGMYGTITKNLVAVTRRGHTDEAFLTGKMGRDEAKTVLERTGSRQISHI